MGLNYNSVKSTKEKATVDLLVVHMCWLVDLNYC